MSSAVGCRLEVPNACHGTRYIRVKADTYFERRIVVIRRGSRDADRMRDRIHASVRIGDWKGVRQNLKPKGMPKTIPAVLKTELYNLKDDLAESTDVAAQHPDIVAKIEQIMREQHIPSAEFPLPALDRSK